MVAFPASHASFRGCNYLHVFVVPLIVSGPLNCGFFPFGQESGEISFGHIQCLGEKYPCLG